MKRRRLLLLCGLPTLVVAAWLLVPFLHRTPVARLPALPDLEGRPAALVKNLERADRAARESPDRAKTVGALGRAYHRNGFPRKAAECYGEAERLDPDGWRWRYLHALVLQETGDAEGRAGKLREVLERNPGHALAWYRLGEAELERRRLSEAEDAFRHALALGPTSRRPGREAHTITPPLEAYATAKLARIAELRGDLETVRGSLATLVEREPGFGEARRTLGRALTTLGQEEEAARQHAAADRCLPPVPPADPEVDALLRESASSVVLLRHLELTSIRGNPEWASYLAWQAVEADPEDMDCVAHLAETHFQREMFIEALPWFMRCLPRAADPLIPAERINECLCKMGRFKDAIDFLRRLIRQHPDEPFLHGLLGTTLFRMGSIEEAGPELERALTAAENHDFRTTLGACRAVSGRMEEAVADFRRVLAEDPCHGPARRNLVLALLQTKDLEAAREEARAFTRLMPEGPEGYFLLARVARAAGRDDQAREQCRRALARDPGFAPARKLLVELAR